MKLYQKLLKKHSKSYAELPGQIKTTLQEREGKYLLVIGEKLSSLTFIPEDEADEEATAFIFRSHDDDLQPHHLVLLGHRLEKKIKPSLLTPLFDDILGRLHKWNT